MRWSLSLSLCTVTQCWRVALEKIGPIWLIANDLRAHRRADRTTRRPWGARCAVAVISRLVCGAAATVKRVYARILRGIPAAPARVNERTAMRRCYWRTNYYYLVCCVHSGWFRSLPTLQLDVENSFHLPARLHRIHTHTQFRGSHKRIHTTNTNQFNPRGIALTPHISASMFVKWITDYTANRRTN